MDETTTRAMRSYITGHLLTTTWTDHDGQAHEHATFNAHEAAQLRTRLRSEGIEPSCGARMAARLPDAAPGALAALKRVAGACR